MAHDKVYAFCDNMCKVLTYAKSQIDELLAGKANTSHTHDDRYYTETEINTKLNGKQNSLGFTPVQQGGGSGQSTNKIHIGWDNNSHLKAQVDITDLGNILTTKGQGAFHTSGSVVIPNGITGVSVKYSHINIFRFLRLAYVDVRLTITNKSFTARIPEILCELQDENGEIIDCSHALALSVAEQTSSLSGEKHALWNGYYSNQTGKIYAFPNMALNNQSFELQFSGLIHVV